MLANQFLLGNKQPFKTITQVYVNIGVTFMIKHNRTFAAFFCNAISLTNRLSSVRSMVQYSK